MLPRSLNVDPAAVRHRIAHLCSLLTLDLYGIRSITIYYRRRDLIYTIIRDALNPAVSNDAVFTRFSRASEEHPWLDEMIERRLSNGECFGITNRERVLVAQHHRHILSGRMYPHSEQFFESLESQ